MSNTKTELCETFEYPEDKGIPWHLILLLGTTFLLGVLTGTFWIMFLVSRGFFE